MRSGDLDRDIEIQEFTTQKNTFGEEIKAWTTLYNMRAKVTPVRGEERYAALQNTAAAEVKFKIRYREDISTLNGVLYEGRSYDIVAVMELGRKEALELMARTRGEQGTK